jgi:hypothetical protein
MFGGQVTTGGWVSLTVTLNEQLVVFSEASVAVQVTVCVPVENLLPDCGEQVTVTIEHWSLPVGVPNATAAEHWFASAFLTISAGQVREGGWLSLTVMVKLQLSVIVPLVAVQVTTVTPVGKEDPDGGLHATLLVPLQPLVTWGGG